MEIQKSEYRRLTNTKGVSGRQMVTDWGMFILFSSGIVFNFLVKLSGCFFFFSLTVKCSGGMESERDNQIYVFLFFYHFQSISEFWTLALVSTDSNAWIGSIIAFHIPSYLPSLSLVLFLALSHIGRILGMHRIKDFYQPELAELIFF